MILYIDRHRDRYGVESICQVLPIAPSTYYAAKRRPSSARALRDQELKAEIARVHAEHFGVYGARKVWRQRHREGIAVARCTVERLMREPGPAGCASGQAHKTTTPSQRRPTRRSGGATSRRPGRTACGSPTSPTSRPGHGWVYVAFVMDAFSRFVVGWQASRSLRTDLALDALEMALWRRRGAGWPDPSFGQGQYLAIRYTERLAEAGAVTSVGSRGDSYDNALAESFNGLYKAELIRHRGPWKGPRRRRVRHPGVRRLVQPPPAPGTHWLCPARRVRGRLLPKGGPRQHRRTQAPKPPLNPGRFTAVLGPERVAWLADQARIRFHAAVRTCSTQLKVDPVARRRHAELEAR